MGPQWVWGLTSMWATAGVGDPPSGWSQMEGLNEQA